MARDIYIWPDTCAHKSFLLWALLRRKELALSGERNRVQRADWRRRSHSREESENRTQDRLPFPIMSL